MGGTFSIELKKIQDFQSMFFWILILYSRLSTIDKTDVKDVSACVYPHKKCSVDMSKSNIFQKWFWIPIDSPFGMALFNRGADSGAKKSTRKPNFGTFGPIMIYI